MHALDRSLPCDAGPQWRPKGVKDSHLRQRGAARFPCTILQPFERPSCRSLRTRRRQSTPRETRLTFAPCRVIADLSGQRVVAAVAAKRVQATCAKMRVFGERENSCV